VQPQPQKLYEELGGLARFVESAMSTISEAGPQLVASSTQLPTAASHLQDLSKLTEDGTLEVMRLTELMQENHGRANKDLAAVIQILQSMDCMKLTEQLEKVRRVLAEDDKSLTDIMTALSFQDLVAQRVKKLVAILDEVQTKLVELVVVFGLQQGGKPTVGAGVADKMLKQLEESKTTAMKQQVADDLLAQFGFK